ncbi:DUF1508 domain-containing protein [Longibacter salinarum]|uniref:DUF1508 domain-containing protein n=1 Tax=Longibacter salinarum TaxID=1850348 RepID=A0A2A8CZV7_9BACT|nr:DUF1508 domain-containing protein [Longibacter salinarum]PEN13938.1 DUF1508 domain-containing protein [Longibacter salinarum]
MPYKFEIYKDKSDQFRFRFKAPNGQTMFSGGQGYASKASLKKSIASIQKNVADADVVEEAEA